MCANTDGTAIFKIAVAEAEIIRQLLIRCITSYLKHTHANFNSVHVKCKKLKQYKTFSTLILLRGYPSQV